ncbi:MAG: glycoside hydrolase N-terminal domain-containing protein [Clostridia bacterium]|nr:glycoside hydrolase N-terminal domain-containing protein [Clostridia bacterium]
MKNTLINLRPAQWHLDRWRDSTPIGSGKVGALIFGDTAKERIIINDHRLWHRGIAPKVPDMSGTIEKMRSYMDASDFHGANDLLAKGLTDKGYRASLGTPHPLCALEIDIGERSLFTDYSRTLLLDKALAKISWREGSVFYSRRSFVSRKDDTLWVEFTSSRPTDHAVISLVTYDTCQKDTKDFLERCGNDIRIEAQDDFIIYTGKNEAGIEYGAVMKLSSSSDIKAENGQLTLRGSDKFTVRLRTFAGEDANTAVLRLKYELSCFSQTFDEALDISAQLHKELYSRVELNLCENPERSNEELLLSAFSSHASIELLEKLFRFARYLFICGTHSHGDPFPLYGLFHGRYSMPWPHNMANENVQMIYRHTLSGDLPELTNTLIDYYLSHIDTFRENAKKLFGLEGIYLPAGTTPSVAVPNQVVPVIMNWISCAGWLCSHFYDHCLYTGDDKLLREKVLPFMYEAAKFIEGYIVIKDGKAKIYPSVSPENTPGNLMTQNSAHLSHPCPCAINATMDIAVTKELLTNLIAASKRLNMYQDKLDTFKSIIDALPKYKTNSDGAIAEWQFEGLSDNYYHRHLSHLYPVFPGKELVLGQSDETVMEAFKKAVSLRRMGAQTGWSLAHMACLYARFDEGDKALEMLDALSKSCLTESLMTMHNDYRSLGLTMENESDASFAPIQLDALMGCAAAVYEMLLFEANGVCKLLPALPGRFKTGSFKGFRSEHFSVSASWGKALCADFSAVKDGKITILLPKTNRMKYVTINESQPEYIKNCRVEVEFKRGDKIKIFEKEPKYEIRPRNID